MGVIKNFLERRQKNKNDLKITNNVGNIYFGKKLLEKGKNLTNQEKYIEAIAVLENAYAYIPTDQKLRDLMDLALYNIIEPMINGGRSAEAKEILLKYSHIENGDVTLKTLNNLSWACNTNREYEQALEYSNRGLQMDDKDVYLQSNRGNALIGFGKYQEALEPFDIAIKYSDKTFTVPLFGKGVCLFNLERYGEAEEVFKKYLDVKKSEDVHGYMVECLYQQGKYEQCIEFINSILNDYHTDFWYHYKKGMALSFIHSYHAAMESFDEALYLEPAYTNAYYSKCRIYCRFHIFDGAFEMLKKSIELNKDFIKIALEDEYLEDFVKFDEVRELLKGEEVQ